MRRAIIPIFYNTIRLQHPLTPEMAPKWDWSPLSDYYDLRRWAQVATGYSNTVATVIVANETQCGLTCVPLHV